MAHKTITAQAALAEYEYVIMKQIRAMQVAATQNHFPIMVARDKAILAVLN